MRLPPFLLVIVLLVVPAPSQEPTSRPVIGPDALVGNWEGVLETGMVRLRLVLRVTKGEEGLAAVLDSLDQGAKDLAVKSLTVKGGLVRFEMAPPIVAGYEGLLSADAQTITGKWTQTGEMPLVFRRVEKPSVVRRPQEPKPPFPYDVEEVALSFVRGDVAGTFAPRRAKDGEDRITLAGTFTRPKGKGPFPSVVLLTGSGPQDRDETLMGHRPFLVLADHLTCSGVAVLRMDDRGVGGSTGDFDSCLCQDFVDDAVAAAKLLRTLKGVDPERIGLCGHSQGGMIAPWAAHQDGGIAFLVLLAAPGVSGTEILRHQGRLIERSMGASAVMLRRGDEFRRKLHEVLLECDDEAERNEGIEEVAGRYWDRLSEAERKAAGPRGVFIQGLIRQTGPAWFRDFMKYTPRYHLKLIECPLLVLNGERDLQVDPSQNLPPIVEALTEAGHSDFTVVKLPGLNHLFQTCRTGSLMEYSTIEETMAPLALETISGWISRRFGD